MSDTAKSSKCFITNNLFGQHRLLCSTPFQLVKDPLVRSKKTAPFTMHRSQSASNLSMSRALAPLNVKPVERRMLPPPPPPPPPTIHKVVSMAELAPEVVQPRGRKQTEFNVGDSTAMASFLSQSHS